MAGQSDVSKVLDRWGETCAAPGSLNGAPGQGVSDAVIRIVRGLAGVERICDLGCGNGFTAARLGALGYHVEGVDASERLLDIARAEYASERVVFHQGLIDTALVDGGILRPPFDLVMSVDVIEHLYRPMTLVETAARLVRPGGALLVCTPYYGYLKNLLISMLGQWDLHHSVHWDGGHIKFFSPRALTNLLEREFQLEAMHYHGRVRYLSHNMIAVARRRG